jgi:MFS family permease
VPSASEISEQVARESERRARLAVPGFAGGFLYLLSGIITTATLNAAPTVGLLQGMAPALEGKANPAVSPRASEVKFISHNAFALIAGSTIAAIAIAALTLILLLLVDATSFRRPASWKLARPLVLYGGISFAVVSVVHQIVSSIETHRFAVGHDFSNHAVDNALTKGTANTIVVYLALIAGLALAAGMVGAVVNALRVGLLPRWMGILGMLTGVLIFLPIGGATLEVVPAFWMVMMGILLIGKWPNEEPPAWKSGQSRPWPSRAQMRAAGGPAGGAAGPKPALSTGAGDVTPAPTPAVLSSRKRRRKRGGGR